MPLVVALHGCTETADVYRQLSGWDSEAQAQGFIVLFPQQSSSRNSEGCWNWFVQADMQRGSGEPSIIAGMVTSVEHEYSIDTHRVYVAGAGTDADKVIAEAEDLTLVGLGWPVLEEVDTRRSSEIDPAVLASYASADVTAHSTPTEAWTVIVRAAGDPPVGSYRVGDALVLDLRGDPLHPDGTYRRRITGIAGGFGADVTLTTTAAPDES